MDPKQFDTLIDKLNLIIRLQALTNISNLKTQQEKILALSYFGFTPAEIASMLGTSSNVVSVTIHKAKKKLKLEQESKTQE